MCCCLIVRLDLEMGNEKSKSVESKHSHHESKTRSRDNRIDTAFERVSGGSGVVSHDHLLGLFGEDLTESLWNYLSDGQPTTTSLNIDMFGKHLIPLFGMSTDIYVKICQPVHRLVKVCSESAGASALRNDVHFIKELVKKMTEHGDTVISIVEWKNAECPRFCHALQALVSNKLLGYEMPSLDYSSDILTPLQMWFVYCTIPESYFPKDKQNGELVRWSPLYTSTMQGISVNRLETNVFDYKGHTVTVMELTDERTVVLATDAIWRHGSTRNGGVDTVYLEIAPNITKIEAPNSIYCNFKIRSAAFGLSFKEIVKIDKELSQVRSIEVWGCASAQTHLEQKKLREWQSREVEKNKKVPLPGNWDDNPDKSLLEMAGFQFSNERTNMEAEATRRERGE